VDLVQNGVLSAGISYISRSFHKSPKENRVYGINRGLVLALRLIGGGHSAAERLMSVLNLPSPVGRARRPC